jgi:WD40 repeat protein
VTDLSAYPTTLAWSASGQLLAVGQDSGEIDLMAVASGAPTHRIHAHEGPVQSLAWHPRRDALVSTGQDGAVRIWEAPYASGRELMAPGDVWTDHACWSANGERLAIARGPRAHVFADDKPTCVTEPSPSTLEGLAFSPSGKSLGVACYGGVRLFDPSTGRPTRRLEWRGSMISLAFAPDGAVVACGCQDNSVHFWRIASGKDAQMSGFPSKPRSIGFNHDGQWLATTGDAAICLWPFDKQGPEGRRPVQLVGHEDLVVELAFAPLVDLLLSGSKDGVVGLWAPPKHTAPVFVASIGAKVTRVAWGTDGHAQVLRWAAAGENGRVMIGEL